MKNATTQNTGATPASTSVFNKIVAVITALSLVFLQAPISGLSSQAMADATDAAQAQLAANTAVDVPLTFENAYITYAGQVIAPPATVVTIPGGAAMEFTAAADAGYQLESVRATINGTEVELAADGDGVYALTAADVATTTNIYVRAITAPTVETVVVEESAAEEPTVENAASPETEEAADAASASAASPNAEANTRTEYTYEDADVKVTATLSQADAVPADAVFQVKPITATSDGYSYDVLMEALNDSAADIEYTPENTLLYDIAFMVPKTDAAGNAIAGEFVEYEPTAGSVAITVVFKKNQLSDSIDAESGSDVEVIHLPLSDSALDAAGSTENAADITVNDVSVESVSNATASVEDEEVSFTLSSLSPTVFTTAGSSRTLAASTSEAVSSAAGGSAQSAALQASSLSNGVWDLADDANTMWMHVVTDQSVTENEQERDASFRLTFSYQLTEAVVKAMDAYDGYPTLVYDLNDMIANAPVKDNIAGSGFITIGTRKLGTYTIEDNVVKIVFTDKAYLHNRTSLEGWFRLTMETDETKLGSDEEYTYTFPGTTDVIPIHYVKNVSNGTKYVNTTADRDGNYTLSYTANIKANLELDSLKFIDTLGGMQSLDASSVKVNGRSVSVTTTGNGFEFDVATALGTGKVAAGTYTVTYNTKVTAAQLKDMQANQDTETNTASWKVNGDKDVPGGQTTTTLNKPHENIPVEKKITDGKQSHQPGDTVTYETTFGTTETKLAGLRIADYMTDVQTLQGDIAMAYGSTSMTMPADEIAADDGRYSGGMTTLFDYTFPNDVQGTGPVTVRYTTKIIDAETAKANGVYGTTNVVNTAQEKRYDTSSTTTTTVPYEKEKKLPVSKTASGEKNANGEWEPGTEITYTLTVGDESTDMAGVKISDYMTDLQVLQGGISIRVGNGASQNLANYVAGAVKYADDGKYSANDVTLFDFTMPSNAGKGPVVITYTTKVISQEQASANDVYGNVQIRNTGRGGNGSSGTSGTGTFDDFPIGKTATVGGQDVSGGSSLVKPGDTIHYTLTFGDASMNLAGATVSDDMTDIQRVVSDVVITKADGTKYTMPRASASWMNDGVVWFTYNDDDNYTQWNSVRVFNYKLPSDIGYGPITIEYDAQIISDDEVREAGLQATVHVNNAFTANGVSATTNPTLDLPGNYKHEYQASKAFDRFDLANNKVYWNVTVEKTAESAYPIENVTVGESKPDQKEFYWSIYEPNQGYWNDMGGRTPVGSDFDVANAVVTTDDGVVLTPGVDYLIDKDKASFTFPVLTERVHINFAFNSPVKIIDGFKMNNNVYANNGWVGASAEYLNPGITLMKDGSYDESSRIVEWTVQLNPTKAEFTDSNPISVLFEDAIPEGLTLVNYETESEENPTVKVLTVDWGATYYRDASLDKGTGVFTAQVAPTDWSGAYRAGLNRNKIVVSYKTKLSDEAWDALTSSATGTQVYENHAKVTAGDNQSFETTGKVEVTSEEYIVKTDSTKDEGGVVVDDNGVQTKAISYTVEINPHGYTLNPGKTLSLVDYIDTNMDLDTASVSIVKVNADGTETSQDGIEISYNDDSRLLKLTEIPDKTHFRLTYSCNARAQGQDTFKNTATLIGAGSHSSTTIEEHKIQTSDAGVRVDSIETFIHKIDENDIQQNLAGAQFQLYKCELAIGELTNTSEYNQEYWENLLYTMDHMVAGSAAEAQVMEQFKIVSYVPVGDPVTTEGNGFTQWDGLSEHTLYAWKEINAPDGYTASDAYHYFVGYQHIDVNSDQLPQPTLSDQEQTYRKHAAWALDDATQLANGIRVASMANLTTWTATNVKSDYTSISATKAWEGDSDNLFETRPVDGITLQLYRINADGSKTALFDPVAVNADENGEWPSYLWSKLPTKDAAGNDLKYTVVEAKVPNYSTSYSDGGEGIASGAITVTNKMIPKNTSITVKKEFGAEVSKEQMPEQVVVNLLVIKTDKDGNASEPEPTGFTRALYAQNNWQVTFDSLPTTDSEGHTLTYTVSEADTEGFEVSYSDNQAGVIEATPDAPLVITNSTPKGKLKVAKSVEGDVQLTDAQKQAVSFTVTDADENVVAEFTLADMGGDMTKTVDDLAEGAYTVTESVNIAGVPTGYTMTTDYNVAEGKTDVVSGKTAEVVVTNTYQPETTSVPVKKVWNDENDKAGLRPSSVTVHLWNGATEVGSHTLTSNEVDENGNWTYTFDNLPKYENGTLIAYTLTEDEVKPYRTEIDNDSFTITNSYEMTTATVKKAWNDADDKDGMRPDKITVALSNGDSVELNEANGWSATVKDLPKYKDGQLVSYTWSEDSLPAGYTLTGSTTIGAVTVLTNSYTAETTEASVKKVWDDANDQDGKRPESLTVTLSNYGEVTLNEANGWSATVKDLPKYKDGAEVSYTWSEPEIEGYELTGNVKAGTLTTLTNKHTPETTSATVKKVWDDNSNRDGKRPTELSVTLSNGAEVVLNAGNNWTATVEDLPKYADGVEISYTWTEGALPEGYELTDTSVNGAVTTLTNTHTPETTELTVKKVWDDAENQDGKRPESLTVALSGSDKSVILSEANNWQATIKDLPVYKNGKTIEYQWSEVGLPEGYELTDTSVNGTVTTLTNSYTPETTEASIVKVWDDAENQDGKRPTELSVTLSNGAEVVLNAGNNWTATVEDLPKYADGVEISYTWTEGALPEGYELTDTSVNGTVTTLTNTYAPEVTTASVKKIWDDANDQDGKRPESLTVALSDGQSVTLNEDNDWTAKVENLPVYKGGKKVEYTWTEGALPEGYELTDTSVNGTVTTLTNSYTPETTEASVKKVWDDESDQDGKRPESLTVTLSNGTTVELNEGNGWEATVKDLPKYKDGAEVSYTWAEPSIDGYTLTTTEKAGTLTTLTNKHTPEKTAVSVRKVWDDSNDQDGKRPESLTVALSDGQSVTLSEDNGWTATISGLPKYADGNEIEYTWTEGALPAGYELTDTSVNGTVTTLTNTYAPETTEASVKKVWDDSNDQDRKRPQSLTVTLSNGQSVTLNAGNNWTATVEGLPKYAAGQEITYSWTEGDMPQGYSLSDTSVNGTVTTLTNTYAPEETSATVKKIWDDANDQDGKRPESLTVTLSDGQSVTLSEDNGWTATISGLPKYADGNEIEYTWTEGALPAGYTLASTSKEGLVTTLTNSYTPETTEATVMKVWDDAENQDGKRPTSIDVTFSGDGKTYTLNQANNWQVTIENLPKYNHGEPIVYTWVESTAGLPAGYSLSGSETEGTVTTISNSYTPETTEASVVKVWADANNQDGKRPAELTVTLSNGAAVTLNEGNNWTAKVESLPKYANGVEIEYTWTEGQMPEGYALTGSSKAGTVTTLTNSRNPQETSVTIGKAWDDANNQDGLRPPTLTVGLSSGQSVTLSSSNNWTATISGLPMYAAGELVAYTWSEASLPEGYSLAGNTTAGLITSISNRHTPETTEATIVKVWDDADDQDGLRPDSLTVTLSNGAEVVLNEANNWRATVEDLPKYDHGVEIEYTWTEGALPAGYTLASTSKDGTVTTITNKHVPATTEASVVKVWNDGRNQDGIRPTAIAVTLSNGAAVELNAANDWSATVGNLPKYDHGVEIEYTWTEGALPDGYTLEGTSKAGTVTTITNRHTPETTEASIVKVWDDAENQDGLRPAELAVTLSNYGEVTLNAANSWRATIKDLPKYAAGQEVEYAWTEADVADYTLTGTAVNGTVTTLTNTHTPETTEATVVKVWNDSENQDGKRPESLTITLSNYGEVTLNAANSWRATVENLPKYQDGDEVSYTWAEGVLPEGYTLTNTATAGTITTLTNSYDVETTTATVKKVWDDAENQDGIRPTELTVTLSNGMEVTLNAANKWEATVTGLPAYSNGKLISYTWSEPDIDGYTLTDASVNGTITTLTNKHTPAETEAAVKKVWDDASNQDGIRPLSLTVILSNGQEVVLSQANNWTATVDGLPKYSNGEEVLYTWTEGQMPAGYALSDMSVNGTVTTLTNTHVPDVTSATVKKVWADANDQDGKRPESLTVTLSNGQSVTLSEDNGWTATVENLPKYADGEEISYTWTESALPTGYTLTSTSKEGLVTTLTNSYTPELTSATVKKVWDDAENQDGARPDALTVVLSNGTEVELNAANGWEATVENLPKFAAGKEIVYTWTESEAGLPDGYTLSKTEKSGTVTTLTNSYTPEETSATVKKVWDDAENQDGKRPESLMVALSNGEEVELNAENGWTATITGLPKYADGGQEIPYTWTESVDGLPQGYSLTSSVKDGTVTTLTNSYTPELTSATVKKVWDDANDQDGKRPEALTVTLSNGTEVELNAANGWEATVENLPKYAAGKPVTYTWVESQMPEGYALTGTSVNGTFTTLTNSYTPELTSATVKKVWDDASDQDGKRPENLTVTLSNGSAVTLSQANNWQATVENLPKYADGVEIEYTWTEGALPNGYTLTNTSKDGTVTTLTNAHTPETVDVTVKKAWDDSENQDGKRPTDLSVVLSNGMQVTLNAANGWEATVENLPKYVDGKVVEYSWTEIGLSEKYTLTGTATDGLVTTLTNSYDTEETSATVKKVWDDDGNQDGIRPTELVVTLSNGAEVVLNAANGWEATVEHLPAYNDGVPVTYTWSEPDIDGYVLTDASVNGTVTTLTNTHVPDVTSATVKKVWDDNDNQDGIRPAALTVALSNGAKVTLNEANGWSATLSNLPKYAAGKEIAYTWTEVDLPSGYSLTNTSKDGTVTTLTNTHTPELTSATVKKVWDDADDQDGIQPDSLTVVLSNGDEVVLSADNGWEATVEGLPKYAAGKEVSYTWTEGQMPEGYALTGTSVNGTVTTLTNTHVPDVTSATVRKVWDDSSNQDGLRPAELTVVLSNGAEAVLNEANGWSATIGNLPKYAAGEEITYTWVESESGLPEGYTLSKVERDGAITTLTNSYSPEETSATVRKVWNDGNDQDGLRPASLTVTLSNGTEVELNADNGWTATVTGLPKYADGGQEIPYTWTEGALPQGYSLTGTAADGTVTTLTNTHVPDVTSATVKKVWDDNENQDGLRPAELTVALSNGTEVVLSEANDWTASVMGLPKNANGAEVSYTWTEVDLPQGYELTGTSKDGLVTTLTNTVRTGDLAVTKTVENTTAQTRFAFTVTLDDERVNGQHGDMLFENGVATFQLAGGERAEATGIPAGVGYAVTEEAVEGYEASSTGSAGTIAAGSVSTAAFTNVYEASASVEFVALKSLDGRTLGPAEFSFSLSEKDAETGALTPVGDAVNNGAGEVRFGAVRYTLDDLGTHTYVMSEVAGDLLGVTYDASVHEFTVTVSDGGDGTLSVMCDGVPQTAESGAYSINTGITFTNTYTPSGSVVLEATKLLEGGTLEAGAYTFQVADQQDTVYATATNAADGTVTFPALTFKAPGTYVYRISEVVPEGAQTLGPNTVANGVAYDTHSVKATIVAIDNFNGTLRFDVTYEGDGATFTNATVPDAEYPLTATKLMQGRAFTVSDAFTFTVTADDERAPMPERSAVTVAAAGGNEAAIDFGDITFTTDDLGRTYTYTIAEEGAGETVDGLQYDPFAHWVKLTVNDAGDGTMRVDAQYQNDGDGIVFTNTYSASAQAVLTATKVLEGRDLAEGEFFFELTGADDAAKATLPGGVDVLHASNAADGTIAFQPITFSADDAGKDFTYTISETQGTLKGIMYDEDSYDVTVHVADNGDGTMSVSYDWGEAGAPPTFTNRAIVRTGFEFDKYHFGGEGTFSFTLTAADADGSPRAGTAVDYSNEELIADDGTSAFVATVQNGAYENGVAKVVFPEIGYAADGDYYYLVAENASSTEGMIADEAQYLVHVSVADGVAAEPVYELIYDGVNYGATTDLSFYNNSAVTLGFNSLSAQSYTDMGQRVSVYPEAQKYLNGSTDQLVGGDFTFELVDQATGQVIAVATNDEAGKVAFFDEDTDPGLAYDEPGEYRYLMREVAGDEVGMTYDDSVILMTVSVTQTADGLAADVTYNGPGGAEPTFYNVKEGIDVVVYKVSRFGGEGLADCTYALWMAGAAGDVMIQEATSDETGRIVFRDVALMAGQKYYFKEVAAPKGHTVDPYRTAYFSLNEAGDALVFVEDTASDGWHSANENIELDKAKGEEN